MKRQVVRSEEAKVGMICREFFIGAGSAIGGDAIARTLHSETIHHALVSSIGVDVQSAPVLFPLSFLFVMLSVRGPMILIRKIFHRRARRIHHVIRRA